MVYMVPVRNPCEKWTRIFSKRMELESVNDDADQLGVSVYKPG